MCAILCSMTGIVLSHRWRAQTHCDYQQSKDFTNQSMAVTGTKFSHPSATCMKPSREPLHPFQGELHVDKYNPAPTGWQEHPAQLGGVDRSLLLCPLATYLPPFPVHLMDSLTTTTDCPQMSLVRTLHEAVNTMHFQLQ